MKSCHTIIWTSLLIGLSVIGCSSNFNRPANQSQPQFTNPAYQTNLYGNLEAWKPVSFDAKPFSSLEQHSFCQEGGDFDPDISKDGGLIVFSSLRHSPNPDLYIKRTDGATATLLTSDPASEIQPCFSPEADKVAYASNRSGNWDIWVVGVDGANPTRLTTSVANEIHPSWSPDGKYIVFCSYGSRSQQWELWIINTENPTAKKWIGYGMFPEWSPNPAVNKIAFQLARYRGSQWFSIWTVDIVGEEARFPTEIVTNLNYACICPSWSPNADWLAYSTASQINPVSAEQSNSTANIMPDLSGEDIYIVDLNGRNNLRLTSSDAADFSPVWSPDNRVFFCSDRQYIENIWSMKPNIVDFSQAAKPAQQVSQHPQRSIQAN